MFYSLRFLSNKIISGDLRRFLETYSEGCFLDLKGSCHVGRPGGRCIVNLNTGSQPESQRYQRETLQQKSGFGILNSEIR